MVMYIHGSSQPLALNKEVDSELSLHGILTSAQGELKSEASRHGSLTVQTGLFLCFLRLLK